MNGSHYVEILGPDVAILLPETVVNELSKSNVLFKSEED